MTRRVLQNGRVYTGQNSIPRELVERDSFGSLRESENAFLSRIRNEKSGLETRIGEAVYIPQEVIAIIENLGSERGLALVRKDLSSMKVGEVNTSSLGTMPAYKESDVYLYLEQLGLTEDLEGAGDIQTLQLHIPPLGFYAKKKNSGVGRS